MRKSLLVVSIGLAIAGAALAQTPKIEFEVASIRASDPITPQAIQSGKLRIGVNIDAQRVDLAFLSLADLLPIAFNVKSFQVQGPDWLNQQRFDIIAKIPEGATQEQLPQMLQAL